MVGLTLGVSNNCAFTCPLVLLSSSTYFASDTMATMKWMLGCLGKPRIGTSLAPDLRTLFLKCINFYKKIHIRLESRYLCI